MPDQYEEKCSAEGRARQSRLFLCYGALAIALSVGFGYSMASISNQETVSRLAEASKDERDSLHRRYMRQLNLKDKEIKALHERIGR